MAKKYLDDNGLLYLWGKIKAAFLSAISYDTTNKKLTVTKNGSTTDLVTAAKIVEDGGAVTDISGKADKVSNGTENNFAALDGNGNIKDSGSKASDFLTQHQDISGKADKDDDAVQGNIAVFDASGNPVDSGSAPADFIPASEKGSASGVATLDASGRVPSEQLPSYVDDVVELIGFSGTAPSTCAKGDQYYNTTSKKIFTATATDTWGSTGEDPEAGKIYVLLVDSGSYSANDQFRWGGSEMVKMADGGVTAITNAEIDAICV